MPLGKTSRLHATTCNLYLLTTLSQLFNWLLFSLVLMIKPYLQQESNKIICKFVKHCLPHPTWGRYLGQMLFLQKKLRTEQAAGIIKFTEVYKKSWCPPFNQSPLHFNFNVVIACGCTTLLYFVCLFKAHWSLPWATDVMFGKLDSVLCEFINNKIINSYWRGSWKNGILGKFVPKLKCSKTAKFLHSDWHGEWHGIRFIISLSHSFVVRFIWSWLSRNNFEEAKGRKKCAGKTLIFYLFFFVMDIF